MLCCKAFFPAVLSATAAQRRRARGPSCHTDAAVRDLLRRPGAAPQLHPQRSLRYSLPAAFVSFPSHTFSSDVAAAAAALTGRPHVQSVPPERCCGRAPSRDFSATAAPFLLPMRVLGASSPIRFLLTQAFFLLPHHTAGPFSAPPSPSPASSSSRATRRAPPTTPATPWLFWGATSGSWPTTSGFSSPSRRPSWRCSLRLRSPSAWRRPRRGGRAGAWLLLLRRRRWGRAPVAAAPRRLPPPLRRR